METKDTFPSCSNSKAQQMQQNQDKSKRSCMVSLRQLHSHLKCLSQNNLQGSRTEFGFKRAFATLSGKDTETFTGTMFLNVEQLEMKLDKEDFQEIRSMAALDTTEEKVDTSKALDASSVDTESSRTESKEHDTCSRSGNDAHDDDANIRPIYNEEPMAEILHHFHFIISDPMETKDTFPSCSNSDAQQMQQNQDKAKRSCMVSLRKLHSHLKRLSQNNLQGSRIEFRFKRAFTTLSGKDTKTFTGTMFLNVEQLEMKLDKEDFQEIGSMAALDVLKTQFQMFIMNRDYLNHEYVAMTRSYFMQYTQQEILEFHNTLIQHLESVKKSINERAHLKREHDNWVNERQIQTTEEKVDTSKALDASSVDTESSRTESKEHDTCSRSGYDAHDDDANIRPIYNEEPIAEHTEQPEFNKEGEIDQNVEECHDTCPLLAIFTDNLILEHSYQSLESKKSCLKKTVAQFQKDFSRLKAHCVNLEIKYQNKVLNEGKQSQFMNEKSNEAKVKHDIDVIETINIELEHKVAAKLLKENETLKKNYKELFDSIKITRAKTIEHTTSLIATNDKFKAQLQEKGFAIAA
nr:hypothetical protein [Tanacetum cinerariifolium]